MKTVFAVAALALAVACSSEPAPAAAAVLASAPAPAAAPAAASALAGKFGRAADGYEGALVVTMAGGTATVQQDSHPLKVLSTTADSIVVSFDCEGESGALKGKATIKATATGAQFELAKTPDAGGKEWDCQGDWDLQFGAWNRI